MSRLFYFPLSQALTQISISTCEIRCPLVILLRSIYGKLSLGTKEMVTKCATSV